MSKAQANFSKLNKDDLLSVGGGYSIEVTTSGVKVEGQSIAEPDRTLIRQFKLEDLYDAVDWANDNLLVETIINAEDH